MTGYLTGHMYGKLVNATYLEMIVGPWLELTDESISDAIYLSTSINDRPSWV